MNLNIRKLSADEHDGIAGYVYRGSPDLGSTSDAFMAQVVDHLDTNHPGCVFVVTDEGYYPNGLKIEVHEQ